MQRFSIFITAEVFLKAFHKIDRFEWRSVPVSAWLYRIASSEINYSFHKSKYKPAYTEDVNLHQYLLPKGPFTEWNRSKGRSRLSILPDENGRPRAYPVA